MTTPRGAQPAPLTEAAVGRQLAELTAALQRAEASHREMQREAPPSGRNRQQRGSTGGSGRSQDDWERFVWQLETYAALVDSSFPGHLEEARRESDEGEEAVESEEYRQLSVKLFGMLVSLVSECPPALKMARGIRRQDGFLLWRQLWREFHPEQANRGLIWRRALLSPKFPSKESEFSAALQEWESDLAKYEAEFGVDKAISDEDKRALLMVESPSALKQHIAMTAGKLTKYEDVRGLVVSYLQAKRVWTPSGAYAQPAGRRHHDPDAMDIGKVGDAKGKDGHTVKECWYNAKGKGKGAHQKGGVHAVSDDTASQLSAGPSASVAGSTATTAVTTKPGVRHISDQKMRILAIAGERQGYLLADTGATVSVCRPEAFLEPVNTAARQTLYSVDDTPLDTKGTVEPVLKLGRRSRQEAKTTFQVVGGITDDILSVNRAVDAGARVVFDAAGSYIEWEDGSRADFIRSGRQFLMPYTCAHRQHKRARVAAVGEEEHYPDDPEAQAVADFARAEAAAEEERRELAADPGGSLESGPPPPDPEPVTESVPVEPPAHAQAWCPECVQGLEAVVQMDYTFYSRGAQQRLAPVDESILVTVLTLVDRDTGWPCSVQVPKKGAECGNFVLDTVEQYLNTLGHSRVFQVKTTDKMTPYKIVNGVEYLSSICRFGETVMAKLPKPGTKAQRRWIRGLWVGKLDRDNTNIILTECGALSVRSVRRLPAEAQANRTLMGSAAGVPLALRPARRQPRQGHRSARDLMKGGWGKEAPNAKERGARQKSSWAKIESWASADDPAQTQQRLASVMELLDSAPDPAQIQQARLDQLRKLWRLKAFTPIHKKDKPTAAQTFHYKWVDKVKEGVAKSRFTCADVKRAYTAEQEQDLRVFVPTPTPEAHALLEITALQKGCAMRTFDIVAAFLIGQDRGAQEEKWVYMRPPPEWRPIWEEWVREQPPAHQARLWGQFNEMLFRLDGNLYGRRTAGSVYRDELEEVLCVKLKETGRYDFKRGVK
ncbi:PARP6, partial [Symbiodinium sp. KB8]